MTVTVPVVNIAGLRDGERIGTTATPRAMQGAVRETTIQRAEAQVPAGPDWVTPKVVAVQKVIVPRIIALQEADCRAAVAVRAGHTAGTRCAAVAESAAPPWLTIPGATTVAKAARHSRFMAAMSPVTSPTGTIARTLAVPLAISPRADISAPTTVAVHTAHSHITARAAVLGLVKHTMDMPGRLHPPIATGTGLRVGMDEPIAAHPTHLTIARKAATVHAENTVHVAKTVRAASMGHAVNTDRAAKVADRTLRLTMTEKTTIARTAAETPSGLPPKS